MITPKVHAMCNAAIMLHDAHKQFTLNQIVEKLRKMGHDDAPWDIQARVKRLVANRVLHIANELGVASGAPPLYTIDLSTILPYMAGDRQAYLNALNKTDQPALFAAWGISIPDSVHAKYPNAQVHRQSWN